MISFISDQVVAAGACALEHECNQSMCTRILSDYWFINYTSVEEGTGSGIEGEYVEIESGMNPLNEEPTFDVRYVHCHLLRDRADINLRVKFALTQKRVI